MELKFLLLSMITFGFCVNSGYAADKTTHALSERLKAAKEKENILVWVSLKDKEPELRKYSVIPDELLSPRSISRREKLSTSSVIDFTDLPVSKKYIAMLEASGFKTKRISKWLNAVSGYVSSENLAALSDLECVSQIDVVKMYKSSGPVTEAVEKPSDYMTLAKSNYSLNYGASITQLEQINVPAVHEMGIHGENVVIGVFDAGFDNLSHEVFSSMNIIAAYDFVNDDPIVADQSDMGEGDHGTSTLSAVGGYKLGQLIGPAFKSSFILAKTENTDSETPVEEDNWIAALEWADSIGVDVTSTSLGYIDFDSPYTSYTWKNMDGKTARITNAADLAVKKGIIVVNSAGNEGYSSEHNTLGAPADGDSVITVGAVNYKGSRSSFSSVGPTADGRIKPDVMAMGSGVYLAGSAGNSYYYGDGTSFSCPLAAGVAALVKCSNTNATPMQVRDAMRLTASNSSTPNNTYGWGILNAGKAVEYVRNLSTTVKDKNVPDKYCLSQNYPNPFNPSTNIDFYLPENSIMSLELYDVLGRRIAGLAGGYYSKGWHNYRLNASAFGLSSGVYFVRMQADKYAGVIKIVYNK